MIIKNIREGEKIPFGYLPIGISFNKLGCFEIALCPFNYLIKWWRNKNSEFKLEIWEKNLLNKLNEERHKIREEGRKMGREEHQNEMNRLYLEISALLKNK